MSLSDLHHAARALLGVPQDARHAFCTELVWRAHVADKYVKRLRRLHPHWGDGSLRAAALRYSSMRDAPRDTLEVWSCMAVVLDAVTARKRANLAGERRERVCMPRNCVKEREHPRQRSRPHG